MADELTPTKQSTVGGLLAGAKSALTNMVASTTNAATTSGGSSTSSSFLTSPILWVTVVIGGVVLYFAKFKKPSRKTVKYR